MGFGGVKDGVKIRRDRRGFTCRNLVRGTRLWVIVGEEVKRGRLVVEKVVFG